MADSAEAVSASITCPRCQRTSHNPIDVREGYCGACHDWTGLPAGEPVFSQESDPDAERIIGHLRELHADLVADLGYALDVDAGYRPSSRIRSSGD